MKPLFCGGMFNRDGKKMRAVFEREITAGEKTYRIWRKAGNPDIKYPRAENDRYLLHIEINGWLVPFRTTYFQMLFECGYRQAIENLYGGEESRRSYFQKLHEAHDEKGVTEAIAAENKEIERCGEDTENQAAYIQKYLDEQEQFYLCAKDSSGDGFPSFIGALLQNDLEKCLELSAAHREKREKERLERMAHAAEKERAHCEEQNKKAEESADAAIEIIRNGGLLKNEQITFYENDRMKSCTIINYLMRMYKIDVPIRTQGWINEKLRSVAVGQGTCQASYLKAKKSKSKSKCSETFFTCMFNLMRAVGNHC